jgi:hypothetical protein
MLAEMCTLWSKYAWSGRRWTRTHSMGWFCVQAVRSGSRRAESVRTREWQFMQVWICGTVAAGERSTFTWQYLQSIPSCPAWSRWLYGIGCRGAYPTCVCQGEK